MWVTVLASQPSVSIETETTQRMLSPRRPGLPTVFMTSRRRSWSLIFSPACASPVRCDEIAPEALDLVRCHGAEVLVERLAGFELFAVDQQGARPGEAVAVFVIIAEQLQTAAVDVSTVRRSSLETRR